jgi:hypothetical protein
MDQDKYSDDGIIIDNTAVCWADFDSSIPRLISLWIQAIQEAEAVILSGRHATATAPFKDWYLLQRFAVARGMLQKALDKSPWTVNFHCPDEFYGVLIEWARGFPPEPARAFSTSRLAIRALCDVLAKIYASEREAHSPWPPKAGFVSVSWLGMRPALAPGEVARVLDALALPAPADRPSEANGQATAPRDSDPLDETCDLLTNSPMAKTLVNFLWNQRSRKASLPQIAKALYGKDYKRNQSSARRLIARTRTALDEKSAPLRICLDSTIRLEPAVRTSCPNDVPTMSAMSSG